MDSQIIAALKRVESGLPVPDICRELAISTATFYMWRDKKKNPRICMHRLSNFDGVDGTLCQMPKNPVNTRFRAFCH